MLEKSFEHVRSVMKGVEDADLDKKVTFFGHEMTERAVFMLLLGHLNEHMGQEVAYARANGVVPPGRRLTDTERESGGVQPGPLQANAPTCR